KAIATFSTWGAIPFPLSYTIASIRWLGCLPVWRKYTRTSVAPHWRALSTCSHRAEVVLLYTKSRRDWMSVWPRKRGNRAPSFSARATTFLPPRVAEPPHCGDNSLPPASAPCVTSLTDCWMFVSDMFVLPFVVVASRYVTPERFGRDVRPFY